ncbi:uncharacterized protein BO88DRAFT_257822 [Aspergillus vadensis CBS 113365]|uniref:Uncharacterized protein n=1 Tax=Aspergillus vadensis (strain CBS 113365 / IMI 142717 / IBT 24658) TaxID=1448311 RepID=A0A319C423_ASPVC|nr:hypothetical protein BO88DRAFT_257822 [Aspergillus vadensis CBS 113365]PYH70198.1 hypothetical protein BO88DRAFT_257822 [Aspergillus vadensis CBS 113365]
MGMREMQRCSSGETTCRLRDYIALSAEQKTNPKLEISNNSSSRSISKDGNRAMMPVPGLLEKASLAGRSHPPGLQGKDNCRTLQSGTLCRCFSNSSGCRLSGEALDHHDTIAVADASPHESRRTGQRLKVVQPYLFRLFSPGFYFLWSS